MKKVLSLVLVIAMVLSSMSFAFAAKFEDAVGDYEKAIDTLVGLGVVTGYEDGTYRPEKVVTRAEMAKLMVEILGYGDLVAGAKSNFTDTQGHWADAWIALAAGRGIVIGTGAGKFDPDRTVTYNEVLTMIVRGLGYTDDSNEIKSMSWPTNFKVKAAELGITDNVKMNSTGADRGGVAQALYNALECSLVTVNTDGNVVYLKGTGDKFLPLVSRLAKYVPNYSVTTDTLDKDSKNYGGDVVDLAKYMYQNLEVYVSKNDKNDKKVVYVIDSNDVVLEGTVTDVLNNAGVSVYKTGAAQVTTDQAVTLVIEDAKEKEYKLLIPSATGASVLAYYNGKQGTIDTKDVKAKLGDNEGAKVTVIVNDLNKNGVVNNNETIYALVAKRSTEGIQVKNDYKDGKLRIDGLNANLALPNEDGKVKLSKITVSGDAENLTDIKENDVVVAYYALDNSRVDLVVTRDYVKGEVTKTNLDEDTIYIDGTKYVLSSVKNAVSSLAVGAEGYFYLDNFGEVFAFDGSEKAPSDYAIVIGVADGVSHNRFGWSVKDYPQIKLATQDNETVVFDVAVDLESDGTLKSGSTATIVPEGNTTSQSIVTGVVTGGTIDITSKISNTKGHLVKYSVDEKGRIDAIEVVATATSVSGNAISVKGADVDRMVSENTVVFNANSGKYEVVKAANIKSGSIYVVTTTTGANKGKAEVIVAFAVASANDGTYGVIKSVNFVMKDGKKVEEVVALIDGKEVTYLTTGVLGLAKTTTSQALEFKFNTSDRVTGVTPTTDGMVPNFKAISGVSNLSSFGMNGRYFAEDCVVYIYDQSDKAWTIGDVFDIDDDANAVVSTHSYVFDTSDSANINLVVQVVK